MPEHVCPDCGYIAYTLSRLQRHLDKKNKCNMGKFPCDCGYRTDDKSNLNKHKKICKGRPKSIADREKEIAEYQTVLAATGNQRSSEAPQASSDAGPSTLINNGTNQAHSGSGDIVGRDQINHITNNIVVNNTYNERIDHIKDMSMEDLKSKIGCLPDFSTHVKLFELIRTAEDHPENHTMLLPDAEGKTVHYKTDDGWKSAPYQQRMLEAFLTDNKFLIDKIPKSKQDQEFYYGYLLGCNFRVKDEYLMPYYDACRKSLHGNTMKLAESHSDFRQSEPQTQNTSTVRTAVTDKEIEMERLKVEKEKLVGENLRLQLRLKQMETDRS